MPAPLKEPRFRTRFSTAARVYSPTESERGEVHASIERLRGLLPSDIDPSDHPTMLYVVGNLFVGGLVNRNDDAITIEDALAIYRGFEGQQINIEHQRANVVGYVIKAGLSELGTDKLITEDEARTANRPFNVAIVIGLWKVVDKELVEFILSAADGPQQNALSLSFEVGFDDYSIVLLPAGASNLALANRIVLPDAPDFAKWNTLLRINKGAGLVGRTRERVARVLREGILPLGGGIVTQPAAQVKGLTPVVPEDFSITEATDASVVQMADAGLYKFSSTQVTLSQTDAQPFLNYASTIPEEHLYHGEPGGPSKYGREDEMHCTARYGFVTAEISPIERSVMGTGPVRVRFGKVSAFISPDKPYEVLKVDVESEDLCRLNALLGTATECVDSHPGYHPHLTIGYMKPGMTAAYVGATDFEGRELVFNTLTWSPHTGARVEIPLLPAIMPESGAAQVYSPPEEDDSHMATASRFIKLSDGWQAKLAELQAAAKETGLPHGIDMALSDGRTLKALKIMDAATVQSDIEITMSGVVITSMTPGVGPQADDPANLHPAKTDIYPTVRPEKQALEEAEHLARLSVIDDAAYASAADKGEPYGDVEYADPGYQADKQKRYPIDTPEHIRAAWSYINKGSNSGKYTSEQVAHIKGKIVLAWKKHIDPKGPPEAAKASSEVLNDIIAAIQRMIRASAQGGLYTTALINSLSTSVSQPTPPSMKTLDDLKQLQASVKTSDKVEDLRTAFANVAAFAEEIARLSEEQFKARQTAETATNQATQTLAQVQTQLTELSKKHDELVHAQAVAAADQAYQTRRATVEEIFAFDTDTEAELVDEIKACTDDASFTKWLTRAKKLFKAQTREAIAAAAPVVAAPVAVVAPVVAAPAVIAKEVLASAVAAPVDAPITNMIDPRVNQSLTERYRAVFAKNVTIGGRSVEELNTEAAATVKLTR